MFDRGKNLIDPQAIEMVAPVLELDGVAVQHRNGRASEGLLGEVPKPDDGEITAQAGTHSVDGSEKSSFAAMHMQEMTLIDPVGAIDMSNSPQGTNLPPQGMQDAPNEEPSDVRVTFWRQRYT